MTEYTTEYTALLIEFPPRPIDSDADLEATHERLAQIIDSGSLTPAKLDYIRVLGALVAEYENREELPDIYGVEMLKVILQERGLPSSALVPVLGTANRVSEVLKKKSPLTDGETQALAKFFNVSPDVFIPLGS